MRVLMMLAVCVRLGEMSAAQVSRAHATVRQWPPFPARTEGAVADCGARQRSATTPGRRRLRYSSRHLPTLRPAPRKVGVRRKRAHRGKGGPVLGTLALAWHQLYTPLTLRQSAVVAQ